MWDDLRHESVQVHTSFVDSTLPNNAVRFAIADFTSSDARSAVELCSSSAPRSLYVLEHHIVFPTFLTPPAPPSPKLFSKLLSGG